MDTIISEFSSTYPMTTEFATIINQMDIPLDILIWISINTSVLLGKIKAGHYDKFKRDSSKIPNKVIDAFGKTYLQNIIKVCNQLLLSTGDYSHIKTLNSLKPDIFFEKLINQCG